MATMIKTLKPMGNSLALIIDKPILELLNIDASTPLQVTTESGCLLISPIRDAQRVLQFREALDKTNRRHGKVLKKLAE